MAHAPCDVAGYVVTCMLILRRVSTGLLLAGVLTLAAWPTSAAQPRPASEKAAALEILSPQPGAAAYTNRSALIRVRYAPLLDDRDVSLIASLERRNPEGGEALFVRALQAPDGSDRAELRWQPADVPSGTYTLVVRAVRAGEVLEERAVEVRVNRPPSLEVAALGIRPTELGLEATLLADAASPDGVPIAVYHWLAGHGAKTIESAGPKQILTFPYSSEPVFLYLLATDLLGGSTEIVHRVQVPESFVAGLRMDPKDFLLQPSRKAPCGCKQMTIRWAQGQKSGVYCPPAVEFGRNEFPACAQTPVAQIPAGEGCPAGSVPATCELNVLDFTGLPVPAAIHDRQLSFGFEVVADLVNGSTAAACEEGQFTRADRILDHVVMRNAPSKAQPAGNTQYTFMKPNPPGGNVSVETVRSGVPVPPLNSQYWGCDDYASPNQNKRHLANEIRWYDKPAIVWRGRMRYPEAMDDEFFAFVRGPTGECWCQFQVKQHWSPTMLSHPAPGMGGKFVKKIDGLNCQVP